MILAFPIGWAISHVALAAVYYLVVTPIGLRDAATGRDPSTAASTVDDDLLIRHDPGGTPNAISSVREPPAQPGSPL
jgi:hypothetical protein